MDGTAGQEEGEIVGETGASCLAGVLRLRKMHDVWENVAKVGKRGVSQDATIWVLHDLPIYFLAEFRRKIEEACLCFGGLLV